MSTNAQRDQNSVPTMIAALNTDGVTITRIKVNPSNHALKINDATSGTDYGTTNALRDENSVHCLMAVSSVDGVTPVAVYVDSMGQILINSN